MKEEIKIIMVSEWIVLKKNLKKEFRYFISLSFGDYLKLLIFPKGLHYSLVFFRVITLFIVFRFFFDLSIFVLKLLFNFYYIIFYRIFEIFLRLNIYFFKSWFFFRFIHGMIRLFRYFFLFMFFVNIYEDMKKKKIPLWAYIIELFADILIYAIRRQINWRYMFYPILKLLEVIVLVLHLIFSIFAFFIDFIIVPIIKFFRKFIFIRLFVIFKYIRILIRYKWKGKYYLTNTFLFHISNNLQRSGFIAPVCTSPKVWLSAKFDYRRYRRKYIRAELTPDIVDNKALNIYIYLKDLLKETRYEKKLIGFFDIITMVFPYNFVVFLFFFLIYFFMGVIYLTYLFISPIVLIFFLIFIFHVVFKLSYYVYSLCSKDMDLQLLKRKENEIRFFSINSKFKYFWNSFKINFKNIYLKINKVVKVILSFLKKVYEKIFR